MRQERSIQATIFEVFAQHEIGSELKAMSQWLEGQRQLTSLVAGDLRRQGERETGRHGLPADSVLRCALLKQQRQLSYEELAFHLEDSASFRAFARLPLRWTPKKSMLHQTIAAIRAETWEAINQALLVSAKQDRLESGPTVRLDSTVTAALMHEPSDSTLLSDAVRVMTRLLQRGEAPPGALAVQWRDRRRLAKKRARAIEYSLAISSSKPAIRPMPSALCRCSIAIWPAPAHRRGRPPPMVATPAAPISPPPRPAALPTSPSTKSAASPLPRWSRAPGSTVVCATSAPASRRQSPASSARTAL